MTQEQIRTCDMFSGNQDMINEFGKQIYLSAQQQDKGKSLLEEFAKMIEEEGKQEWIFWNGKRNHVKQKTVEILRQEL